MQHFSDKTDDHIISEFMDNSLIEIKAQNNKSLDSLIKWIKNNFEFVQKKLSSHGGVILKGYHINSPEDFEEVAKIIEPNLCDKHVFDDFPRTWLTKYVYEGSSPSVIDSPMPLTLHNEDSYLPYIPSTVMFCALQPAEWGGETLIADCRKVFSSLPNNIKNKYLNKVLHIDIKINDSVLLVNSRIPKNLKSIEELGKAYGAEKVSRKGNETWFSFKIPAVAQGNAFEPVWINRLHHATIIPFLMDIWYTYASLKGLTYRLKSLYFILSNLVKDFYFTKIKKGNSPCSILHLENCSLLEQVQISLAFRRNTKIIPLEKGDIIVLNNQLIAHGRMPYRGSRILLSCMGSIEKVIKYQNNKK